MLYYTTILIGCEVLKIFVFDLYPMITLACNGRITKFLYNEEIEEFEMAYTDLKIK